MVSDLQTHNPRPGNRGRGGGVVGGEGGRAVLNEGGHVALPFGIKKKRKRKKKELMQAYCWEKEKTSSVLFCYLLKLSLIPLILLELIWLNSLSPC